MVTTIEKLSIPLLITYFVIYIILHFVIGKYRENMIKELEEKPGNIELEKKFKVSNFLFKWFPAIYVIIIIFLLY